MWYPCLNQSSITYAHYVHISPQFGKLHLFAPDVIVFLQGILSYIHCLFKKERTWLIFKTHSFKLWIFVFAKTWRSSFWLHLINAVLDTSYDVLSASLCYEIDISRAWLVYAPLLYQRLPWQSPPRRVISLCIPTTDARRFQRVVSPPT